MSATKDIDSVTNSVMMAIDKEFRKNGISPAGNAHYRGNRILIRDMVAMMIALDAEGNDETPTNNK